MAESKKKQNQMNSTALGQLQDHICALVNGLLKFMFWLTFYPGFDLDEHGKPLESVSSKSSRYTHVHSIKRLRKELEAVVEHVLREANVMLPMPEQLVARRLYAICWVVRWLVRRPDSPLREPLLNPSSLKTDAGTAEELRETTAEKSKAKAKGKSKARPKLFGDDFLEPYLDCLKEDWSLTDADVATFREALDSMVRKMYRSMDDLIDGEAVEPDWPQELNQDFVDSHASMGRNAPLSDVLADLVAMLFVGALYGGGDLRWEFGYLRTSRGMSLKTKSAANGFQKSAERNGVLDTYPVLTRVGYDATSADELDYVICSEPLRLKNTVNVQFGRAMRDVVMYNKEGKGTTFIRLSDWRLNDTYMAGVSKRHAIIAKGTDGTWELRDWQSTFGTLVISRSGERKVVGGIGNDHTSQRLMNGDLICFGHTNKDGEPRADAQLPCYLFNRAIDHRDMPDLRTRRHVS